MSTVKKSLLILGVLGIFLLGIFYWKSTSPATMGITEEIVVEETVVVEQEKEECIVVAVDLPPLAYDYIDYVYVIAEREWLDMSSPFLFAAQIDKETCRSPTHVQCWNPKAENKNPANSGEYGFGLGQLTNTTRYNNFDWVKTLNPGLRSWKWDDRFNPEYQILALVTFNRQMYRQIQNICTYDEDEKYKCMFSSYNGGVGSVINDSKLCAATDGCDPTRWTANIELNSYKARTNLAGYNLSAYKINRAYVDEITTPGKRSLKYHTDYLNRMCVK